MEPPRAWPCREPTKRSRHTRLQGTCRWAEASRGRDQEDPSVIEAHSMGTETLPRGGELPPGPWSGGGPEGCRKREGEGQDSSLPISRKGTSATWERGWKSGDGRPGGLRSRDWCQQATSTCPTPGSGGRGLPSDGTEQWGGDVSPAAVSFRTGRGRCRPQGQERGCWARACWPPPACRR